MILKSAKKIIDMSRNLFHCAFFHNGFFQNVNATISTLTPNHQCYAKVSKSFRKRGLRYKFLS